jgi:hypothetical protein
VTALKFFNGDIELENVRWLSFGADGRPVDWSTERGPNAQFGTPIGAPKSYDYSVNSHLDSRSDWLRVERSVRYITKPDPHQCDWRCTGGKPGGECWCQCGGRNHGRNYRCEAA